MISITILIDCWIILSLGEPIPKGLFLPFAFGMYTLLAGVGLYASRLSCLEVSINHSLLIPSRVSSVVPGTIFPLLFLMVSYASARDSTLLSTQKALVHFPSLSNLRRLLIFAVRSLSFGVLLIGKSYSSGFICVFIIFVTL